MRILAIEQSAARGSLALLDEQGGALLERDWLADRGRPEALFAALAEWRRGLDQGAGWEPDLIAVGIGPGAFSALRMAVAAAEGLALPDRRPLAGVHSSEALAWGIMRDYPDARVAVAGDARRQRFWVAAYQMRDELPAPFIPLSLTDETGLREAAAGCGVVATPHGDRIGALLSDLRPAGAELVTDRQPLARDVACLALRRMQRGLSLMPCRPVYLHPAVSKSSGG